MRHWIGNLLVSALVLSIFAIPVAADWEAKVTVGDEINAHLGLRPFKVDDPNSRVSKHLSVGFAVTAVRESPTNMRQLGVDEWSVGGYFEAAAIDLTSLWPQLPAIGEGHAGVELMYNLRKRNGHSQVQIVPYVGICVGMEKYPDISLVTDTRWYDTTKELIVTIGPVFTF
jgi:hypothetical protein